MSIPQKRMCRRQDYQTLGDIFEVDSDNVPRYFNSDERLGSQLKYRIPDHQRYPEWKLKDQQLLVDTVFSNFPMSGFVVSERNDGTNIYYEIEDGQSRLSILQQFYNNKFYYEDVDGQQIYFKDLPSSIQRRFENYKIYIEVMINPDPSAEIEVFERLQNGTALKDKDLYWNRKDTNYVKKAISVIDQDNWLSSYMGTTKGITHSNRSSLPNVVTFIYAILQYNNIKQNENIMCRRKSMYKSFRIQCANLNNTITESDSQKINNVLEYLNFIITQVYHQLPRIEKEPINTWCNLAKQTGMILHEYFENENSSEYIKSQNQKKWIDLMIIERQYTNFMFRGNKSMWNGLRSSLRQNTDDEAISARLNRINEFYTNREVTIERYGINYLDNDYETEDSD